MADEEEILASGALAEKILEVAQGGFGGEGGGDLDFGFVAGLGAYEGGGLEAALEWAGDDAVELYVQSVQHMGKLKAVFFAFLVEWALEVEKWVGAADASAGMAENVKIHNLLIF
jgi:hypothetical protein